MPDSQKRLASAVALALVALAWGTSYAITKDALGTIRPFALMTLRFGLSTVLLAVVFAGRLKNIKKDDLRRGSIIGIFMFLSFLTLVTGIRYTTASKQAFLVCAYVLIVPFLAWVINRRKPDSYSIAGAVLATFGIGLLTLNGTMGFNAGDMISLLCSFFFACHMIAIERFNSDSDPILMTVIQFAVTSVLFILLSGIFESFEFNISGRIAVSVGYLVVVTTVIAFAVQNIAQRYISANSTALILTLESAFGSVFAVFFLGEIMTVQMIIGCVIIFLGIITQETKWDFLKGKIGRAQGR